MNTENQAPLPGARPFLRTQWVNLAMLSYEVDPEVLLAHLPPGCTLDLLEGRAVVSLVAFDFRGTRVLGVSWPGYVNFPEINLRFYVRHVDASGDHGRDRRGVCFIRELVSKRLVIGIARWIYNEPFRAARITSAIWEDEEAISVERRMQWGGRAQRIQIAGVKPAVCSNSAVEHFLKDQAWGFGISRRGKLLSYYVAHPLWEIYPLKSFELDWDWAAIYGKQWGFLQKQRPMSVTFSKGSEVSLYPRNIHPAADHARNMRSGAAAEPILQPGEAAR